MFSLFFSFLFFSFLFILSFLSSLCVVSSFIFCEQTIRKIKCLLKHLNVSDTVTVFVKIVCLFHLDSDAFSSVFASLFIFGFLEEGVVVDVVCFVLFCFCFCFVFFFCLFICFFPDSSNFIFVLYPERIVNDKKKRLRYKILIPYFI